MNSYLIREFCDFYERYRCPHSPTNPMRVFGMAERVYEDWECHGRVTPSEFVVLLYQTLKGVFERFDPGKYEGRLEIEKHFINYFRVNFTGNLRRWLRPRTDKGRRGDPALYRHHWGRSSLRDDWAKQAVQEAVQRLPDHERSIIRDRYWGNSSYTEIGRQLDLHHTTVKNHHDRALSQLRDALSEEN